MSGLFCVQKHKKVYKGLMSIGTFSAKKIVCSDEV